MSTPTTATKSSEAAASKNELSSRVYYGEYSLRHWINLLLGRNIVLPEYQRSFVWSKEDVARLIAAMKAKQFVQPVTIAQFAPKGEPTKNLILDGQQRLTSILLACLSYMPKRDKALEPEAIAKEREPLEDEDAASDETGTVPNAEVNGAANDVTEGSGRKSIQWTFEKLLVFGDTVDDIREKLRTDASYEPLKEPVVGKDFFDTTFLGFSYIVPESDDKKAIVKAYSQIFRNMNYFGSKLSLLESRRSLYYMVEDMVEFFEGKTEDGEEIFGNLQITDEKKPCKIDFVRYLSILSQYEGIGQKADKVLLGYSSYASREGFYADYVSYVQDLEEEDHPGKFGNFHFESAFKDNCWKGRYKALSEALKHLDKKIPRGKTGTLESWIVADYWLFGLMYHILFKGRMLNADIAGLERELSGAITGKKGDDTYTRAPNRLKNLRDRLADSIRIYQRHVH